MWEKLRNRLRRPVPDPEAVKAVVDAQAATSAAASQQREVRAVVAELRYHREVNHFADRIRESMRGA